MFLGCTVTCATGSVVGSLPRLRLTNSEGCHARRLGLARIALHYREINAVQFCAASWIVYKSIRHASLLTSPAFSIILSRMASKDPIHDEKTGPSKFITDSASANVEAASSTLERTLHRQLKNRHIAMIRCSSHDWPFSPFVLTYFRLKYWRRHRNRSVLGHCKLSPGRWSCRSFAWLPRRWFYMLFCHGVYRRVSLDNGSG